LGVRLGNVEISVGGKGHALGRDERGVGREVSVVAAEGGGAVEGATCDDSDPPVLSQLQNHVIVNDVEGIVEGVHGQLRGPAEMNLE
jgi:hypothetical protein